MSTSAKAPSPVGVDEQIPWTAGFTRHSVEIAGGDVSWLEFAESLDKPGPPIVLVHGHQGTALEHCGVGRVLGATRPVYILDLRGHGRSSGAPTNPVAGSMVDLSEMVLAFIQRVVERPVVLTGNSMGAMVCAHTARSGPADLAGLVLIGPAVWPSRQRIHLKRYFEYLVCKPQWMRRLVDWSVRTGKRSEDIDALVHPATPYMDLVPAEYLKAWAAEPMAAWSVHHEDPSGRAGLWRSRNDALDVLSHPRRFVELLNGVRPPALWLHGTDDPMMPLTTAATVREMLPAWQVETVAATGHIPHVERVQWTAARIGDWVESHVAVGQPD